MVRVTNKEREAISAGCGWKPRIMALNRQAPEMKKDTRYNCLISLILLVRPARFELATYGFVVHSPS